MRKILLALTCSLVLFSCSKDDKKEDGKTGGQTQVDITDYKSCSGEQTTANVEGNWRYDQLDNGATIHSVIQIHNNDMTISDTCVYNGAEATASGWSPVTYSNGVLTVQQTIQDHMEFTVDSQTYTCNLNFSEKVLQYSFKGDCLVLTSKDGSQHVLPPAL